MKKYFRKLILFCFIVGLGTNVFSQGTTTSGINGRITDENNQSLPGATIVAVHEPTGTQFAGITNTEGIFNIPNMDIGGPYTITVSFVGYADFVIEDVHLSLGQTFAINNSLSIETQEIETVNVVAYKVPNYKIIDGNRTGAETVVDAKQISALPTVARDITDFTRLTPQASVGDEGYISVAGINNRYNAISIDGALNNDTYGLAPSGTNGGQTGASPFSMDIIEQFQVTLAPYDVRQNGFAGASINAVTKSGTNQLKGTAYYYFRNENFAGKTPTDNSGIAREKLAPFTSKTLGVSLGGPIIKNKVFFFTNFETLKQETPLPFNFSDYTGDSDQSAINNLINVLKNTNNYDPGEYLNKIKSLESTKLFGRIDWNINKTHKLMLRHSYTKSILTDASESNMTTLGFSNNYMYFPSTTNTTAMELKSNFNNFSNSLVVSYTAVRDNRDPAGDPFPAVRLYDGDGTIYFGSEPYSTANELNQDIMTVTDNFQIYKGKHIITLGMNHEFASAYNLFMRKNFGEYRFRNMADFIAGNAYQYERGYSLVDDITGDGSAAAADFSMFQLGFYAQDEWQINNTMKLTYGIRLDIPVFPTKPDVDEHFNTVTLPMIEVAGWDLEGAQAGAMPEPQFMLSPRIGFNWNVNGEDKTQIRGGIGVFTSRLPLVWPGASYNNNGLAIGGVYQQRAYWSGVTPDIVFNPEWNNQYYNSDFGLTDAAYGGQVDLFSKDFKFPQMFRSNAAVDQQLPLGIIGTLEVIYTKTMNNVVYFNVNRDPDPDFYLTGTDTRPHYDNTAIDNSYTRVMLGTNTSNGSTFNITAQLHRPFTNGLDASIAYTYGRARVLNDATSSQNSSQWLYMENVSGLNNLDVSFSDFDLGHRVISFVSYSTEFLNHLKTSFTIVYNCQSGGRYSYTYDGYLNGDNEYNQADLIYIPENQSEIVFENAATANAQWAALDAYIENDKYLNQHRGEYAERNGARAPWSNIFDLKFSQDLFVNMADRRQTLQLTIDVFNFGNLLHKDWGRKYYVSDGNYTLIDFEGFDTDGTTPMFSFEDPENDPWSIDDSGTNSSRWHAQIGIRYIF